MAKEFTPSISIEKMAAYLDNNLSTEEMSELDTIIEKENDLSDILSEIDLIDTAPQTVLPSQEFILEQLILPVVALDEQNYDLEDNQITNNLMNTTVEKNPVSFEGTYSPEIEQHYQDTCAIKSQAIILNALGHQVTEEQLIQEAMDNGWYRADGNGTSGSDVGKLMELHDVHVFQACGGTIDDLIAQTAAGHQVIVAVDSGELWHPGWGERLEDIVLGSEADHALIFSGIEVDPFTNEQMVLLTDPGTGMVCQEYNVDQFMDAWSDGGNFMVSLC